MATTLGNGGSTSTTAPSAVVNIPNGSIYDLQKSLSGVVLLAYLTAEPVSEKKPSRLTEATFHPVRPWLAAMDAKGAGFVWNYETKEVVTEFSLESSQDAAVASMEATEEDEFATSGAVGTTTAKGILQRSSSPTAYVRGSRSKVSAPRMLFYDHEAINWTTKTSNDRTCYEDWLIILTTTHVMFCDLNQPTVIRSIPSDDLLRQVPCSIEILPSGVLAIGCLDGKIRLWSPAQRRTIETIDSGSLKEVQQLLLLPLCANEGNPSVVSAHFLACATVDGHMSTWKVSARGECVRVPGAVELKEAYRSFDASSGLSELKFHAHQLVVIAASKDGTVYVLDVFPLLRQNRTMMLTAILPTTKLPGATVFAGPRKGAYVVVSAAASGAAVTISELLNKGRGVGRDNLPASYHELVVGASFDSKDLRQPVGLAILKKVKVLSLSGSLQNPSLLCCVTTFGILVMKMTCLPSAPSIWIRRGAEKSPLLLFPGPTRVGIRINGEETSTKQEDYKLQSGMDAPNEKLKTPMLEACPSNAAFVSALLPASTHVEILQMDSELRNQKSINMHMVFSGNAIAVAWHANKPRFALLVPQEPNARRLTRAASNMSTPRRRGFMFGGSTKGFGAEEAAAAAEARLRNSMARAMTLVMYEIADDGHVQVVEEGCSCGDDRLLHVFSGPLLGVVKFESEDDGGSSGSTGGSSTSIPGTDGLHDSPSARNKRTESSVFGAITPTAAAGGATTGSFSAADNDGGDIKKTTLDFYEWEASSNGGMKRIGTGIDCPLLLEWEKVTHRFCALVYPRCVRIYRVTASPTVEVALLHEIPTASTVVSLHWMYQTLFLSTPEGITCYFICKTRFFTVDLASVSAYTSGTSGPLLYPKQQHLATEATTLLGIHNHRLVLAAPVQSLHSLDLSNKVLQCAMLISIGQADLALQVAEHFGSELSDWISSLFEAFAFVTHAVRLSKLSLRLKVNIGIKHQLLDELATWLSTETFPVSPDLTGTSLFQRACTALRRGGRKEVLESLFQQQLAKPDHNQEAVFIASLLQNQELLAQAHQGKKEWGKAHFAAKRQSSSVSNDLLGHWNKALQSTTAPWKATLEQQTIRPPEVLTLLP
ncbi:hypothetical protein Poli38472_003959 [Pythium oligandrum]|uniref:Uncharacterized protein n=1 Tax=Pythium oligandrum TaxID=41045 RepID=A0A8K1FME4_PYTOL|nr:hypothetical protein Poli38472_003959 [Pythium oligandrum]|eukprot:TMW66194.1 hypothetical protein Poli38472_003959 [Pythium oligandrum]